MRRGRALPDLPDLVGRFGTGLQSLFLPPETYLTNAFEAWVITGMARPDRHGSLAALLRWLLRLLWVWEGEVLFGGRRR